MPTSLESMDHSSQPSINVTAAQVVRMAAQLCIDDNQTLMDDIGTNINNDINPVSGTMLDLEGLIHKQRGEATYLNVYPAMDAVSGNGTKDEGKLFIVLWYRVKFDVSAVTNTTPEAIRNFIRVDKEGKDYDEDYAWLPVVYEYDLTRLAVGSRLHHNTQIANLDPAIAVPEVEMNSCTAVAVQGPPSGSGEIFNIVTRGSSVIRVDLHGCHFYSIIPSCVDHAGGATDNSGAIGFAFGTE